MAKWIYTNMQVYGNENDLKRFKQNLIEEGRPVISFNKIITIPEDTDYWAVGLVPGWHNWRLKHWGTERDALDSQIVKEGESILYRFITTETSPIPIFETLISSYTELNFKIGTGDPVNGWELVMVTEDGEYIEHYLDNSELLPWNNNFLLLMIYRVDFINKTLQLKKAEICKEAKSIDPSIDIKERSDSYNYSLPPYVLNYMDYEIYEPESDLSDLLQEI